MIVNLLPDYLDVVEERQRLEGMLERGRKEFSAYGLELFERGIRAKIARLTSKIEQYEVESGYWVADRSSGKVEQLGFPVCGGRIVEPSSFAYFPSCSFVNTVNVQMIPGCIRGSFAMVLNATHFGAPSDPLSWAVEQPTLRVAGSASLPSLIFPGDPCCLSIVRQAAN
jgi:hypothetical protein